MFNVQTKRQYAFTLPRLSHSTLVLILGLLTAITIGVFTASYGTLVPVSIIISVLFAALLIGLYINPKAGFIIAICYCFLFFILVREASGFPFGIGIEGLFILTCFAALFHFRKYDWYLLKNDLFYLTLIWFIISFLEVVNPAGASVMGWMQEMRTSALYPLLIVLLSFIFFNKNKDLNIFLILIIALSLTGTLNGIKQLYIGLSPGEQQFLDAGGAKTHLIWGKLRVFSFFSDASQFGVSQAHIGLIAFILALGPFKWWKKALLLLVSGVLFYGMLISGTRGALFALITGGIVAIVLTKNWKFLILGSIAVLSFVAVLKYTTIGSSNYEIYRLRTALDPKDASLNTRFINQQILKDYLKSRPFGGGLGVTGYWGRKYNQDKFLAHIPPDSYWVKVWAMYGIVGLIIWFGMMMYITGKCCGIVWNIRDKRLKFKLIALCAGATGVFFASYGNEIINDMPSAMVVYISWAFIYLGPRLDTQSLIAKENEE
jgi:hypothetical protein